MDHTEFKKTALHLIDILRENYDHAKHHEHYTIWGVAYFWDQEQKVFKENPDGVSPTFPAALLDILRSRALIEEPQWNVPKKRNQQLHTIMYCLSNREGIETVLAEVVNEARGVDAWKRDGDLLSDRRLLAEALQIYVDLRSSKAIAPETDFIDFLLRYSVPESRLLDATIARSGEKGRRKVPKKENPPGSFVPLAQRLVFRYGDQEVDTALFAHVQEAVAQQAYDLHQRALYGRSLVRDPALRAFYEREVAAGLANGIDNGYHHITIGKVTPDPEPRRGVNLPGRRRVTRGYSLGIDWEQMLGERRERVTVDRAFNREELMKAALRERLLGQYLARYETDPAKVLEELRIKTEQTRGNERDVWNDVYGILKGIRSLDSSDTIAHHMPISVRR